MPVRSATSLFVFKFFIFLNGFDSFASVCICAGSGCSALESQKRALGSLELKLQKVVGYHRGAGNQV